ncbi:hypothetical protein [Streptomyces sp. NPDC052701]|uniref:hypothetical protein n=1 Tax=Streptomyces sp. NPDC052701 TaxID=3155533 RepID=UPI003439460A
MISETQALALAARILRGALPPAEPGRHRIDSGFVRNLGARIGELEQAIRAALAVLDAAEQSTPEPPAAEQ